MAGGSSVTQAHLRQLLLAVHLSPCRNRAGLEHFGLQGPPVPPQPCPTAHLSFVTVPKVATGAGMVVTSMMGPAGRASAIAVDTTGVAMVASRDTAMANAEVTLEGTGPAESGGVQLTHSALGGRGGFS